MWNNRVLTVTTTKDPKKITGTRFAAILGKNKYSTPFSVWCDITHAYDFPYEESKYTLAGKIIEPLQAKYVSTIFNRVVTPQEIFGENYFNRTHGNFYTDPVFGGMWDYLLQKDGITSAVFEMKTTGLSHKKEWEKDIPEYYALQAALYAYLLNVDQVYMVVSFLDKSDYVMPALYEPNSENTMVVPFSLHERYPDFQENYIDKALEWWNTYVVTNTSPEYDEVLDADLVQEIKRKEGLDMDLTNVVENSELLAVKNNVDMNVDEATALLTNIVDGYTSALDELMSAIQEDIIAIDDPPVAVVERYFMELSNAIYFVGGKVEKLGVYDGMSKLTLKEKFNNSYIDNKIDDKGKNRTAAELTAISEDASKLESVVNDVYNKAYKIVKAKVDAAQTMCATLSKVYSMKAQQMQNDSYLETQNAKRILNEGV